MLSIDDYHVYYVEIQLFMVHVNILNVPLPYHSLESHNAKIAAPVCWLKQL